jgi:hypothetical protein
MTVTNFPAGASPAPTLSPDDVALARLEQIIEKNLPHFDEACAALLQIHKRKLYKLNFKSFEAYLKERLHLSRSRGYQMVHFGRLRQLSTTVDGGGPANEREARKINARGQVPGQLEPDQYATKFRRVTSYLAGQFKKTPPVERRRFIVDLRGLLQDLEASLPTRRSSEADPKCDLQNEPRNETRSPALAGEPPGSNPEPARGSAELAAGGKGGSRLNPVGNPDAGGQSISPVPGLDPPSSVAQFSDPAGPSPLPFRAYTIEEARQLGLAR